MQDFTATRFGIPLFATASLIAASEGMSIQQIDSNWALLDRFGVLGAVCVVQWIVIRYIMQKYEKIQADRFSDMEERLQEKNDQVSQLTTMITKTSTVSMRVEKLLNEIENTKVSRGDAIKLTPHM